MSKAVLVVGTCDTKDAELRFLTDGIVAAGGAAVTMDVGVLGAPVGPVDVDRSAVAAAGGMPLSEVAALGDENAAMQVMARGAAALAARMVAEGRVHGMIALGGTMGTDLALDVAAALPLGVPKYVVSTVAFSPLIPAARLSPDIQMMLWAGGLYGLNAVCRASLAQAAGAVWGAVQASAPVRRDRPVIGMTSLGSSCLRYMTHLTAPLEARGFEVAVFHATGMGGMAFERLAAEGFFACVMDFALPELGNLMVGSAVNAGEGRLQAAGARGVPQIVAPGCIDLIDFPGWQAIPEAWADRPFHAHNRLIQSAALTGAERADLARDIADRLDTARGPVRFLLPAGGVEAWDLPGEPAHDPAALAEMCAAFRAAIPAERLVEIDGHINDAGFAEAALAVLDGWIAEGVVGGYSS